MGQGEGRGIVVEKGIMGEWGGRIVRDWKGNRGGGRRGEKGGKKEGGKAGAQGREGNEEDCKRWANTNQGMFT